MKTMKTNFLRFPALALLLLGAACTLLLNACSKDPVEAENETQNKLHDDPAKVTIRLVECHLHADWYAIQEAGGPHQNPESAQTKHMKRIQEMTYELKPGKGWQLSEGSIPRFRVQKHGDYYMGKSFTPAPIYLMFIEYYNAAGEPMNGQFVENGQDKIHQHFFTPENVQPTFDGKKEADDNEPQKLLDYLYTDTTPWNKSKHDDKADITGKDNPIGLKGVVRFLKARKQFDLKVRLYHGYHSKVNPKTGEFDPFYKPSSVQIQRGTWDINLAVPFVIYMDRDESIDIDDESDLDSIEEDGLDEDSNRALKSIMKAYDITWREAMEEFVNFTYRDGDRESGSIWL